MTLPITGCAPFDHGAEVTGADLSRALLRVDQLRRQLENFFDDYDLLLTPTMAVPAFPIDQRPSVIGGKEVDPFWGYLPFTFPINMTGQTAASIPCGFSEDPSTLRHAHRPARSRVREARKPRFFRPAPPLNGPDPGRIDFHPCLSFSSPNPTVLPSWHTADRLYRSAV